MQSCGTCPWLVRLSFLSNLSLRKLLQEKFYSLVRDSATSSFITFSTALLIGHSLFTCKRKAGCDREGRGSKKPDARSSICITKCMIWAVKMRPCRTTLVGQQVNNYTAKTASNCLSAEVTVSYMRVKVQQFTWYCSDSVHKLCHCNWQAVMLSIANI